MRYFMRFNPAMLSLGCAIVDQDPLVVGQPERLQLKFRERIPEESRSVDELFGTDEESADRLSEIVEHIRQYYGADFLINHMVLSHADDDHATGLVEVMKNMRVQNLWMNRPWLYSAETVQHFHGLYSSSCVLRARRHWLRTNTRDTKKL